MIIQNNLTFIKQAQCDASGNENRVQWWFGF